MRVENAYYPTSPQIAAFFGSPESGAFVMVNLLKFKPKAIYADGTGTHLTGMEAYARYGEAVAKLIVSCGGRLLYSGGVTGLLLGECDELWDMVALVEYPSLAAFQAMTLSPTTRRLKSTAPPDWKASSISVPRRWRRPDNRQFTPRDRADVR
jgi:uncharacterized protein (DUF1330 family)